MAYLDKIGLAYFWNKIKTDFATKEETKVFEVTCDCDEEMTTVSNISHTLAEIYEAFKNGKVIKLVCSGYYVFNPVVVTDEVALFSCSIMGQYEMVTALIAIYSSSAEILLARGLSPEDIVDNLTTNESAEVLSAKQGVVLKSLIDSLNTTVSGKSDNGHKHTSSDVSGLATVATSGKYSDLKNIPIVSNKAYTNGNTWYFPLGSMVIDDSGNYGNFTFTGRLGGWTNQNAATFSIMLMNRANYDGNVITATVSASGQVTNALAITDIVVAKNSDLSHTVYLKCNGYFCFDFAYTEYQHSIIYDGSYSTTAPSDIIWTLSEAPKTILSADGSFSASGGISADTVGGKHIVVSSSAPTSNDTTKITIVI